MKVLVTGAAGFIGMHLAHRLREDGAEVVAVDSFDPYYDVALKRARAARLLKFGVRCEIFDLADAGTTAAFFRNARVTHVAHMAAQPGVRYSLVNPAAYLRNNVDAFGAVLAIIARPAQHPAQWSKARAQVGFAAMVLEADQRLRLQPEVVSLDHDISDVPPGSWHRVEVDEAEPGQLLAVGRHVVLAE